MNVILFPQQTWNFIKNSNVDFLQHRGLIVACGFTATCLAIYKYYRVKRDKQYHTILNRYYSKTYNEARDKFAQSCKDHNFIHHRISIPQNPCNPYLNLINFYNSNNLKFHKPVKSPSFPIEKTQSTQDLIS